MLIALPVIRHIEEQQLYEVTVDPVDYEVVFSILAHLIIRIGSFWFLALVIKPGGVHSGSSESCIFTKVLNHQTIMLP